MSRKSKTFAIYGLVFSANAHCLIYLFRISVKADQEPRQSAVEKLRCSPLIQPYRIRVHLNINHRFNCSDGPDTFKIFLSNNGSLV